MPRVYLTKQDKLNNKLVALIYGAMKVKKILKMVVMTSLTLVSNGRIKLKIKHFGTKLLRNVRLEQKH